MALPQIMVPTPNAPSGSATLAEGITTDAQSEFYQRVTGNVFVVYSNVPYALAQHISQSPDPDTLIAAQLASYPKRIVHV